MYAIRSYYAVQNARRLVSRNCPQETCPDQAPTLTVDYIVPSVMDHLGLTVV